MVRAGRSETAKMALKRKKQHEHSIEQTQAQIGTLEQQINAIESANINRETLAAMEKVGEAMKQIHGKLTPEKVDETITASARAIDEQMIGTGTVPVSDAVHKMPTVANGKNKAVQEDDEEEELRKLQAEMAFNCIKVPLCILLAAKGAQEFV
ncbi:unnamed protein product [Parascedosporium putredinis]|uniref:Vacuolar-sorting protein SNF7 n=1 Tax=Parascedosporium putredinis TaxID=1442378 RepID=A0A9P1H3F5_9PEZI|nr:unnamed protein product [Parascedosporium putredinis]CAI7995790.1 unnamed protein product [Parascedosporium putredinis]